MSNVLYKRTGKPDKKGNYLCEDGRGDQAIYSWDGNEWLDVDFPITWHVAAYYSETPPPELAEVFENIQSQLTNIKENEPDDKIVRLPAYEAQTLLNELLN